MARIRSPWLLPLDACWATSLSYLLSQSGHECHNHPHHPPTHQPLPLSMPDVCEHVRRLSGLAKTSETGDPLFDAHCVPICRVYFYTNARSYDLIRQTRARAEQVCGQSCCLSHVPSFFSHALRATFFSLDTPRSPRGHNARNLLALRSKRPVRGRPRRLSFGSEVQAPCAWKTSASFFYSDVAPSYRVTSNLGCASPRTAEYVV